jgi:peroxin-10
MTSNKKIKFIKSARQPEVIRTIQKDLQYTTELNQNVYEVAEFLVKNNRNFLKLNNFLKIGSQILYHGFAAVNRLQTLGEEYTGVIQIDTKADNLPKKFLQVAAIVLEFAGESLLIKLLNGYEKKVKESEELLPEAKTVILKFINVTKASIPYVKALHRGFFFLNASSQSHMQISKRLTGIKYVLVRFWLNDHHSLSGYKFLGIVTILQVIFSLLLKLKERRSEIKIEQAAKISASRSTAITTAEGRVDLESTKKCILCLENRIDLTSTVCGHLFCWGCVLDWIKVKNNCPICREPLTSSAVIFLQNYF